MTRERRKAAWLTRADLKPRGKTYRAPALHLQRLERGERRPSSQQSNRQLHRPIECRRLEQQLLVAERVRDSRVSRQEVCGDEVRLLPRSAEPRGVAERSSTSDMRARRRPTNVNSGSHAQQLEGLGNSAVGEVVDVSDPDKSWKRR
eukprot:768203-Hanusia_phi.AAC.7